MSRSVASCLLVLLFSLTALSDVNSYQSDFLENGDGPKQQPGSSWPFFGQLTKENDLAPQREEALQRIQKVCVITVISSYGLRYRVVVRCTSNMVTSRIVVDDSRLINRDTYHRDSYLVIISTAKVRFCVVYRV